MRLSSPFLVSPIWPAAVACLLPLAAHADVTRGAVSVTSDRTMFFAAVHLIDQSGLSSPYVNGVTDFATFASTVTHAFQSSTNAASSSITGVTSPIAVAFSFDLGAAYDINGMAFYNLVNANNSVTGLSVYADNDMSFANGTVAALGSFVTTVPTSAPVAAQVLSWTTVNTRYLTVVATANNLGTKLAYGATEVVFSQAVSAVPEPSTLALTVAGLGVVGGMGARRRRA